VSRARSGRSRFHRRRPWCRCLEYRARRRRRPYLAGRAACRFPTACPGPSQAACLLRFCAAGGSAPCSTRPRILEAEALSFALRRITARGARQDSQGRTWTPLCRRRWLSLVNVAGAARASSLPRQEGAGDELLLYLAPCPSAHRGRAGGPSPFRSRAWRRARTLRPSCAPPRRLVAHPRPHPCHRLRR
jgi:hypothetical protein